MEVFIFMSYEIEKVLNYHKEFFDNDTNNENFLKFKTNIKNKHNKKYSIKKLFSQDIMYGINRQVFESIEQVLKYDNIFNKQKNKKFKSLVIESNDNSLFNILRLILENEIKQENIIIKINNINNFLIDEEEIASELINYFEYEGIILNFLIDYDSQLEMINSNNIYFKRFKNKLLHKYQIIFDYKITLDNFEKHPDDIIRLYEDSKHLFRFFNLYFDYEQLKELSVDDLNQFKFYNSFLFRWITSTGGYKHERLLPINISNNRIQTSLYQDNSFDVYITKEFQENKEYKIFNFVGDYKKTGEELHFYELSLLYQQLIMNNLSFIRGINKENQPLIYDTINYYYNLKHNDAIQILSQEVEIFNYIVLRNMNNISWNWGEK